MSIRSRLAAIFGRFSWERPAWLARPSDPSKPGAGQRFAAFLKKRGPAIAFFLAVAMVGGGVYVWKATRPPPPDLVTLTAAAQAPSPPPRRLRTEPVPKPNPLVVVFSGSAAPLDQLDKQVSAGVGLSPALEGEWRWVTERTLAFTPKADWPVGTRFTVELAPALVNRPNLVLETHELTVDTQPFRASLDSLEFYQDPTDPQVKQVVGSFSFNYPVDPASFEKQLELVSSPVSNKAQLAPHKFSVAYDDLRFEAYVRSEALPMPLEDHLAVLTLKKGVKSEPKGGVLEEELSRTVAVPGKGSRFHVQSAQATIVRSAEGDPDQVLILTCTSPVNEKRFGDAVKVWVLPKDKPKTKDSEAQKNYRWAASEVGPEVLKRSTRLTLAQIPGELEVGETHSFKLEVAPGAQLFVRVEAGVEAWGGYVLPRPWEDVVTVPEYPRELRIAHEGSVLSVTGDKKLTVTSRGIPAFRVRLSRIQPKDLNHLVSQSSGDFAHLALRGSLSEEDVSEIFTEVVNLDDSNPRAAQYAAVDFAPHLKEGSEQRGLYFVTVEAWNPKTNQVITQDSRSDDEAPPPENAAEGEGGEGYGAVDRGGGGEGEGGEGDEGEYGGEGGEGEGNGYGQLSDRRFVLLTDLGVIEKVDAQLNHWVFVQSFRTGTPVADAQVEVLAKNGTVVLRRATDGSGTVTLPPLTDLVREKTPVALVVREGGDVSFLPLNRGDRTLDLSRFDVGGVRNKGKATALTAFAFSDRGLYRPGETAHLATLVRAVDFSKTMKGVPLLLAVTDPRGLVVKRQKAQLDAYGFAGLDLTPEERAPTGSYTFTVSLAEPGKSEVPLGSTSFRVEEFLPDRMRMTTRFAGKAPGWLTSSALDATVELTNLFGTPAAGHTVKGSFELRPYSPSFEKYPDYQFFDPARAKQSETQAVNDAETDDAGHATFHLDLSAWAQASYVVSFYGEGLELGGGRGVSSMATVVVSPRKYLLGSKADGDLGFVKQGVKRKVEVIAISPALEKIKVDKLKAVLVEQRYVSVLTRDTSGSYRYQSVLKDVTRRSDALSVSEQGTTLELPSGEVGGFYLSVRDEADVELLRVPYSVAGEANVAKDLERNAELKVSLDKADYEPGATITVQITAPYAGAGVITIERDKVYVHKPFKTTTTTSVQTIEVPQGLDANGYVHVAFVRAIDSPELYVSPLSYGVVPFSVSRKRNQLELSVTAEKLSRPGRPLTLRFKTDRPSKIAVFAADEGILQVARYETPDPLSFFLAKRALEVSTRQIVDQLLPEFRLVHQKKEGGDGDLAEAMAATLNPFKRKVDKPAVYWSGIVEAGPQERTVTFDVPESFSGSLRIMAVAAAPDAMASAQTSTTIRGPFVVSPNVPTFLSPKDKLTVTAAIANNVEGSGDKAQVTVKLEPNAGFTVSGAASQVLTIPEGKEAVASFEVTATEALGDGELRFAVSGAKQETTRTAHVSVRPPSAYLVATQAGTVKDKTVELKTTRRMFDQLAKREVLVSLLPLGLSAGAIDYLENYPHLCSEQLTSRAVPALVFARRPEWGYEPAKAKAALTRAFDILAARQNEDGEFGYWAANSFVSQPLDVYITLVLTEAKERGQGGSPEVRQKALQMLKRLAEAPLSDRWAAVLRAQALYVLARNEVVMPGPTAQLADYLTREKGPDLGFAYLAATWALTNNTERGNAVMGRFKLSDQVVAEPEWYFDDASYQAQVLYLVSKHFPARLEEVGPKVLQRLAKSLSSPMQSLTTAQSLLALDAYATAMAGSTQGALGRVTVEVQDDKGQWKPAPLAGGLAAEVRFDASAKAVRIAATEGALVFYSLVEGGFDRDPPATAIKEGLELIHTVEDGSGKEVTRVALGDEVTLRVRTRSLSERTLSQLALVDLLPSGFEVVLEGGADAQGLARLVGGKSTWQPTEVDAREDRVVFYGDVTPKVGELTYRIKAVARGTFVVPPAQLTGMYEPALRARSTATTITVE